jgi:hypothetical protein
MAEQVCAGATLMCSFGAASSTLNVTPENQLTASGPPAATINDFAPMENIMPFAMCSSPTNPAVIAATAAKLGVFTPAPCVPATLQPWRPGSPTITVKGQSALSSTSTLLCQWGGIITVSAAGQTTVTVP